MAFAKLSGSLLASRSAPPAMTKAAGAADRRLIGRTATLAVGLLATVGAVGLLLQPSEGNFSAARIVPLAAPTAESADAVAPPAPAARPDPVPPLAAAPGALAAAPEAEPAMPAAPPILAPAPVPAVAAPAITVAAEPAAEPAVPAAATAAPIAPAVPAVALVDPAVNAALLARGDALFVTGDVASARLFYERAANAGDGAAALRLGETYDPAFIARTRFAGAPTDASKAAGWYRRARELGMADADVLLDALTANGMR
jgi:hypothetical protein